MKLAILMLTHKNEAQVNRLVEHLARDFDIFVHIDSASRLKIPEESNVFVYKKYKVYWGSFNQIMATLYLLQAAYRKGYDRYILISGQDLPLRSNAEISGFFENNDTEYLNIRKIPDAEGWPNMSRLTAYHPREISRSKVGIFAKLFHPIEKICCRILTRLHKRPLNYDFYGGAQWTNLTHSCVTQILAYLEKDKKYLPRFRWTNCADEIFYQTILHHLEAANGSLRVENNCLRAIDWKTGPEYPRTLRMADYEKIMQSGALFARKFDDAVDAAIIDKIYASLKST